MIAFILAILLFVFCMFHVFYIPLSSLTVFSWFFNFLNFSYFLSAACRDYNMHLIIVNFRLILTYFLYNIDAFFYYSTISFSLLCAFIVIYVISLHVRNPTMQCYNYCLHSFMPCKEVRRKSEKFSTEFWKKSRIKSQKLGR